MFVVDVHRLLSKYTTLRRMPTHDALEARRIVWLDIVYITVCVNGGVSIDVVTSKAAPKSNLGTRTFSSQEQLEQELDVILHNSILT